MAFVVVLHLSPKHESNCRRDAAACRPAMPVTQVNGRMPIERDHVYVIPPTHDLSMVDGYLRAGRGGAAARPARRRSTCSSARWPRRIASAPSASCCRAPAPTARSASARIKEHGGIVVRAVARRRRVRRHAAQPRSPPAWSTSCCRWPRFRQRLVELWRNARRIEIRRRRRQRRRRTRRSRRRRRRAAEEALRDIMTTLRARTGHDFSNYKRATVLRRHRAPPAGQRPAGPAGVPRASCRRSRTRPKALLKDLLISVTNFFRDREAFEALEREVICRSCSSATADAEPAARLGGRLRHRRGGLFDGDAAVRRAAAQPPRPAR